MWRQFLCLLSPRDYILEGKTDGDGMFVEERRRGRKEDRERGREGRK